MSRLQPSLRKTLPVVAVVALGAIFWMARPSWQVGAAEILFLICVPALAWTRAVRSTGNAKDWWTGVAIECTGAIPLLYFLYEQYLQAPFTPGAFTSLAAESSLFLFNLSDRFHSLLLAWGPAPLAGLLYVIVREPLAVSLARLTRKAHHTATHHGWLQFSLRAFLVLLTAFAIWLGVAVNRAREQREALKAIESLGWIVQYDWQKKFSVEGFQRVSVRSYSKRPVTAWMHADMQDLFHNVETVYYIRTSPRTDRQIREAIPYLQRLRGLKTVNVWGMGSVELQKELRAALPDCAVH